MNKIIERIEREAGIPGLVSILAKRLAPTDLQSLLLEVYRIRADQASPSSVLACYGESRFARPSQVQPASLLRWESAALSHLVQEFQPLALSPVSPLGTSSVVASIDQNWAVPTARNTEVVSDSTNVLALECALRRRDLLRDNPKSAVPIHLATSHRLLRGQRYERSGHVPHFASFALCSAGRDTGHLQFEASALKLHIVFYLRALRDYLGAEVPLHVSVTELRPIHGEVVEQLFAATRSEFPDVTCELNAQRSSGRGYYRDLCFHIHATASSGQRMELVDGGSVDWTQKLLSKSKERLIISGIGSERLCSEFPDAIRS